MKNNNIRNGEIDILRFIFAMIIVCYHFSVYFDMSLYRNGGVSVDFFFYLTGTLMILRNQGDFLMEPYKATYSFIRKKFISIWPYYFCAVVLQMLIYGVMKEMTVFSIIRGFFVGLPNYLFVQSYGIEIYGCADIGGSWFLSAMMIASFILFYVYYRLKDDALYVFFPVFGLFLYGIGRYESSFNLEWGGL